LGVTYTQVLGDLSPYNRFMDHSEFLRYVYRKKNAMVSVKKNKMKRIEKRDIHLVQILPMNRAIVTMK